MEHSKKYYLVKDYYDRGLWSESRLLTSVGKWITMEEYEEIINPPIVFEELLEENIDNGPEDITSEEETYENTYVFDDPDVNPNIVETVGEEENDNIAEEVDNEEPEYLEWDESMVEDTGDDEFENENQENGSDDEGFFDEFYDESLENYEPEKGDIDEDSFNDEESGEEVIITENPDSEEDASVE